MLNKEKFYREKEINGKQYRITVLPALKAIGTGKRISKVLLPILGGAVDGLRDDGLNGTPKTFTELATTLVTQLDDFDLDALILDLTKDMMCDGEPVGDIDLFFQGELSDLLGVVEFALRENFEDFFTKNPLITQLTEGLKGMTEGTSN